MKTVLTDISLCAGELLSDAKAVDIYKYIKSLASAGVRYVEIDQRILLKLRKLPKGIGYIYRITSPDDVDIIKKYKLNYALIRYSDLFKNIRPDIPIMLEMPFVERAYRQMLGFAQSRLGGRITAVRFCDDFGYMTLGEMRRFVAKIRNTIPIPVDFCPINSHKTALDCALKLTFSGADCISFTVPRTSRFAQLREYIMTLMGVYRIRLDKFDLMGLIGAAIYSDNIFRKEEESPREIRVPYRSISTSVNADTGEIVPLMPDFMPLEQRNVEYKSALEKMMSKTELDEETSDALIDAVKYFDIDLCSDSVLYGKHKGLKN